MPETHRLTAIWPRNPWSTSPRTARAGPRAGSVPWQSAPWPPPCWPGPWPQARCPIAAAAGSQRGARPRAAAALPRVTVAVVQRTTADAERVLPGNSLPLLEASIYARTTGYLKSRRVDIGDRVTARDAAGRDRRSGYRRPIGPGESQPGPGPGQPAAGGGECRTGQESRWPAI